MSKVGSFDMRRLLSPVVIVATAAAAVLTGTASAQSATDPPPLSIRVTGEASVTAAPDQAERAETARRAAAENARETARVLAELKKRLEAAGTIETLGYSVQPEYRHPQEGRQPQISGFVSMNILRVTTSNLDRVSALVDAAVGAGANRVQRMRFTLKDQQAVYGQALRQAASRARGEADALASALGVTVVRVLSAVEESAPVRPFVEAARTAALPTEPVTPVEPSTIDVDARVRLTVEVSGTQ
jgi:uncharacterized protein YggE